MLIGFHKSNLQWEDYRGKVEPLLLTKWGEILMLCRKHGFLMPEIKYDGKQSYLGFSQIIQKQALRKRTYPTGQIEPFDW